MNAEQKRDTFIDAFLDGQSISPVPMQLRRLVGMVYDLRSEVKGVKNQLAHIDSEFACANIEVKCRSCGNYYRMDYEVSQFTQEMSYCGESDKCLP